MKRLLITGATGRIGRVVREPLSKEWTVLCGVRSAEEEDEVKQAGLDAVSVEITDPNSVDAAVAGCDAVLHLAAISEEADPLAIATVNILGTTYVLEACYQHGASRFVYASSNHAVGGYERFSETLPPTRKLDENTPTWPDSHYGASKVHGEALTRWYVHRPESKLTAACLRIGTTGFQNVDEIMRNERLWSTWMSDRDLVQLCSKALASTCRYGIYAGISGNKRGFLSLKSARRDIGYEPEDDAERLAAERNFETSGYAFAPWQE